MVAADLRRLQRLLQPHVDAVADVDVDIRPAFVALVTGRPLDVEAGVVLAQRLAAKEAAMDEAWNLCGDFAVWRQAHVYAYALAVARAVYAEDLSSCCLHLIAAAGVADIISAVVNRGGSDEVGRQQAVMAD